MDHCEVSHGSIDAIPVLDAVDVEEAYKHIALRYHSVQYDVGSHGLCDHQQYDFWSLGASGSVRELSDQNLTVVTTRDYWTNAVTFR